MSALNISDIYEFLNQEDGYFNMTKICAKANKRYENWSRNKTSKDFIRTVSKKYNIPESKLTYSIKQGPQYHYKNGTYCHPIVATCLFLRRKTSYLNRIN